MPRPSSSKPRVGRPRADGKPPRIRKRPLPWSIRPQIKQMLLDGASVATIQLKFRRHDVTRQQIADIKSGRMKIVKTPRPNSLDYVDPALTDVTGTGTIPDKMERLLHSALDDVRDSKRPASERFAMLAKAGQTYKNIVSMRLMAKLGRRDAEVIVALVRLFAPQASEEQVIEYYKRAEALVSNADKQD